MTPPASYEEWLDAVATGEGFYFETPSGEGVLPPRRCGPAGDSLSRKPLPDTGKIETCSVIHIAAPGFAEDTPYISAIAAFGPVRLTGVVRGVDPAEIEEEALIGQSVTVDIDTRATTDDRLVVFPVE